ncbi:HIT domain-containing protein [Streptomyces sp. MST-110588]|nr:HIT domain-containing protein [Streptomyces sp. MST-110588]
MPTGLRGVDNGDLNGASKACDFCKIVAGRLAAAVLYEDDSTVAFLDITAVMGGHTLVIPKRHAADLWEIPQEDAAAVMRTVHRMAARIRDVLAPDGLTLFQANREAGWQDQFHLHVHLVPRRDGDHLTRPWTASPVDLESLREMRERLAVTGPAHTPTGPYGTWRST